jgi:hypothetical protein
MKSENSTKFILLYYGVQPGVSITEEQYKNLLAHIERVRIYFTSCCVSDYFKKNGDSYTFNVKTWEQFNE